jgi:hypothetical protein
MPIHILLFAGLLAHGFTAPPGHGEVDTNVASLPTKEQYEKLFPHHHSIYTYTAFVKAASRFPLFAGEGTPSDRRRELAAFFANIAHETGNGGPGAPGGAYTWGLYYTEEQACQDGHCKQYNTGGTSPFQPVPGRSYHGRGPLQLSYAYNYGLAGKELGLPLLENPALVSTDGVVAFETALWFWMKEQIPKPSCHQVMTGTWLPTARDRELNRRPGFGMTINIINGGIECRPGNPAGKALREERIGYYKWFAALLGVELEKECDCAGMAPYG